MQKGLPWLFSQYFLLRMKTERKYPEPTVFVFYIMIPFLNIKNYQFQLVSQPFSTIFYIL
jgi:hypothetical protein